MAAIRDLPLESRDRRKSFDRHLSARPQRMRPDGARWADQEQDRSDTDLPPLLPRGHLRLLRHEYQWDEYARLHARDQGCRVHRAHLSAAAYECHEGFSARSHAFFCAAPLDRALAQDRDASTRHRMAPKPRRSRRARRPLRVHPMRLLLNVMPFLLVE